MADPRVAAFRAVTTYVRPPHSHGCPPVEVVPGVWTAHYHDIDTREKLQAAVSAATLVVNAAKVDKCPTGPGSYGEGVEVLCIENLLDDPEPLKKVEAMPQGPEKDEARAALPAFAPEECAGDAYKDFELVNAAIAREVASGGAAMVHCYASLSRSVGFLLWAFYEGDTYHGSCTITIVCRHSSVGFLLLLYGDTYYGYCRCALTMATLTMATGAVHLLWPTLTTAMLTTAILGKQSVQKCSKAY